MILKTIALLALVSFTACSDSSKVRDQKESTTQRNQQEHEEESKALPDSVSNETPPDEKTDARQTNTSTLSRPGEHNMRLQWIEQMGTCQIVSAGQGSLSIDGLLEHQGDTLAIDGLLEKIDDNTYAFRGTIMTRASTINNGERCIRKISYNESEDPVLFVRNKGRSFYRLQQMENCEGNNVVDYIDLF